MTRRIFFTAADDYTGNPGSLKLERTGRQFWRVERTFLALPAAVIQLMDARTWVASAPKSGE